MAVDMFIDMGGKIKGESKDDKHKDLIDVLAWSWGMSQPSRGKVSMQDVSVTKWVDGASNALMLFCANGDIIPKAKLIVRKSGGKKPLEYIVMDFETVTVTSVSTGGSGGEDRLTENVTLAFNKVEFNYKSDSGAAAKPFNWDIEKNCDK